MRYRTFLAVITGLLAGAAHADDKAARDCVGIADVAARLNCYDAAFGRVDKAVASAAPAAAVTAAMPAAAAPAGASAQSAPSAASRDASAASTTAAASAGGSTFGMERTAPKPVEPEQPAEIKATIVGVAIQPRTGRATVTLDNGQVWEQLGSANELHQPRTGDPVSIRKASFGSYLMYNEKRGSSRVQRIK
jgi:hypothetical protein